MVEPKKLDARQIKSKSALFDALDAMLGEQSYGELKIIDLVERAGVGRQTFYRHFESIDAMLEEQLRLDLAEQFEAAKSMLPATNDMEWLQRIAAFAFERAGQKRRLYRLILSGEAGDKALNLFRQQIGSMTGMMSSQLPRLVQGDAPEQLVQSFYAGGISALLLSWLESESALTPDEMGKLFVHLCNPLGVNTAIA